MEFARDNISTILAVIGMGLLIAIMLRRWSRIRRQRHTSKSPIEHVPRPKDETGQPLANAPDDALRWQVEMHETARDLKGELDSKMGALQQLIGMARTESDRLEAAIARAEQLGIDTSGPPLDEIYRLADQGHDAAQIAQRVSVSLDQIESALRSRKKDGQ